MVSRYTYCDKMVVLSVHRISPSWKVRTHKWLSHDAGLCKRSTPFPGKPVCYMKAVIRTLDNGIEEKLKNISSEDLFSIQV